MKLQVESNTSLNAPWQTIARITWSVLALSAIVTFVASLPSLLDPSSSLCNPPATPCMRNLILPEEAALLPQIGLSLASYHLVIQISESLPFAGMWLAISALIFWRRSNERLAVLTALLMIGFPFSLVDASFTWHPVLTVLGSVVLLFNGILPILFFLFPTGKWVPHWTRWVAYAFLVIWFVRVIATMIWVLAYGNTPPTGIADTLTNTMLIYFGVFLLSVACQAYRYWRVSNTMQRQQTKWIFLSILSLPVLDLLVRGVTMPALFPQWFKPGLVHIVYNLVSNPFLVAGFFLVPAAFAISIFRYRLYAIDLIIRRTLIYSSLTILLAFIYYAGVILLQKTFRSLTGFADELAIIGSTLAIAVLFQPLRARIHDTIDRRFYRRKYDAQEVLAEFGATIRDEVELDKLTGQLLSVVEETMQPAGVGLWLKRMEEGRQRTELSKGGSQ